MVTRQDLYVEKLDMYLNAVAVSASEEKKEELRQLSAEEFYEEIRTSGIDEGVSVSMVPWNDLPPGEKLFIEKKFGVVKRRRLE